ncbi:histidine phosphatase family protein [Alkalibacillus aidingensis]|uniref:histidine phosphatase family protein n=1 Tax=Alkalibacillus aidingensis TaxID=2747607 RepID=UPI0016607BA8|nr:histidine phosphatase family protein [Alkalibacillus aidingensis]
MNDFSSLLEELRSGGYVLYARHAEATVGEDQPNLNYYDCSTQRNLSKTGREQAIAYGKVFRSLAIPVEHPVYTSPFCRTRETTALAFGEGNYFVSPFWASVFQVGNHQQQQMMLYSLNSIFEQQPQPGTNRVIIAHSFPEGFALGFIPNMGTVVIRPLGQGNGFEVVDQLTLEDWTN